MPGVQATILLVDDEPALRRIAVRVLQRAGYHCLEAEDGVEALALWQAHRGSIDLIITDLAMPKLNGWELLQAVRKGGSDLPFLIASGSDAVLELPPDTPERVLVIGKPWAPAALAAAVKQLLG